MTHAANFSTVDFLYCKAEDFSFYLFVNFWMVLHIKFPNPVIWSIWLFMLQWYFSDHILQRQHSVHSQRHVTHPYGAPAIPSCCQRDSVAHALPADRQMLHLLLLQGPRKPVLWRPVLNRTYNSLLLSWIKSVIRDVIHLITSTKYTQQ